MLAWYVTKILLFFVANTPSIGGLVRRDGQRFDVFFGPSPFSLSL